MRLFCRPHCLFLILLGLASAWTAAVAHDHGTASVPWSQRPLIAPDSLPQQHSLPDARPELDTLLDSLEELRHALDVMQHTWFALWAGTWPTGIDWTRAVLDTHLVATATTLGRKTAQSHQNRREVENEMNKHFTQNIAYYFGEDAFAIRYQAYDDMLWVVLGWLESIRFINAQSSRYRKARDSENLEVTPWHGEQFINSFAHRAETFWNLTTKGWDTEFCGGGMVWNPRLAPYKNAITNQLFISASVGMYLYAPELHPSSSVLHNTLSNRFDQRHLTAATNGYDWLKNSGMTNRKGLYVDGFHVLNWNDGGTECNDRNEMVYTYNQGVLLSGLRGLWESTGNRSYLDDGHELARNAIRATGWALEGEQPPPTGQWAGLGRNGILEDHCDAHGNCNQDAQSFKGIFMHHLTLLCEPLPRTPRVPGKTFGADKNLAFLHLQSCRQYSRWVRHNAQAALRTRDIDQRFGGWWGASREADAVPVPQGAIDYRNSATELLQERWINKLAAEDGAGLQRGQSKATEVNRKINGERQSQKTMSDDSPSAQDLNDRGRGRTVETQSGGVAVLRALWELSNAE